MIDDLLRLFAFRTAVPCGYLIFFLFGAFCCLVAFAVLVIGVIFRRVLLIAIPAAFLLFAGVFVAGNVAFERALEENPPVSDGDLLGTWRTAQSALTLRPDGVYELRAGEDFAKDFGSPSSTGRWRRDSFEVLLTDRSGRRLHALRVITFRGRFHLIFEYDDPDEWDGSFGFSKRAP